MANLINTLRIKFQVNNTTNTFNNNKEKKTSYTIT